MPNIFLPSGITDPVVNVGGICYSRVGPSTHAEDTAVWTGPYTTCEECATPPVTCPDCADSFSNIMGSEGTLEECEAYMALYDCDTECIGGGSAGCCGTPCWYCAEVIPGSGVYAGSCCCVAV